MLFKKNLLSMYQMHYIQVHTMLWTDSTIPAEKTVEDFGLLNECVS